MVLGLVLASGKSVSVLVLVLSWASRRDSAWQPPAPQTPSRPGSAVRFSCVERAPPSPGDKVGVSLCVLCSGESPRSSSPDNYPENPRESAQCSEGKIEIERQSSPAARWLECSQRAVPVGRRQQREGQCSGDCTRTELEGQLERRQQFYSEEHNPAALEPRS